MTAHLTDEQVRRFCGHEMTGDELLVADDHLVECEECRERAWALAHGTAGAARPVASALTGAPTGVTPSTQAEGPTRHWRGRRAALRWGPALAAMLVIYLVVFWRPAGNGPQAGHAMAFVLPPSVRLEAGEAISVIIMGVRGRRPFVLFRRARWTAAGVCPTSGCRPGHAWYR
jgi:predicted anti-sigma-YlaC factor YlaD